tara:strand:- start:2370 stop:2543 length:174 start_codon:yes stop_codon:yes gene_type:complete
MSLIKQELYRIQEELTERELAFLEGGPVPDFDVIREMEAQQVYYDRQALMDSSSRFY